MSQNESNGYSLAANRDLLVHIAHDDLRFCEIASVALRIEGYGSEFSTDLNTFRTRLAASGKAPSAVIADIHYLPVVIGVRRRGLVIPTIAVQRVVDLDAAVDAVRRGATDVIALPVDVERMLRGLRRALASDIRPRGSSVRTGGFGALTPRERQVLELVLAGHSNKEIGQALDISPRTIEVHRGHIMEKTGARNTADLVRKAYT